MSEKRFRRAIRMDSDTFVLGSAAVLTVFAFFGFNPHALAATDTAGSLVFIGTNGQNTTTLTDSLTTASSGSFW